MNTLKTIDRQPFEDLLEMSSGYVLDFSDATFASFFTETVNKDIHSSKYTIYGTSKAKKLRAFWDTETKQNVAIVLTDLVDLWNYKNPNPTAEKRGVEKQCRDIICRLNSQLKPVEDENDFLLREFENVDIKKVQMDSKLIAILENRLREADCSLRAGASLSAIFMCGSVLEGLLLGTAMKHNQEFNQASRSPKDSKTGKVKKFRDWSLAQMIDVACELEYEALDVQKFSHSLRDFRNYIHPYEQMKSEFTPDVQTAKICMQVLRAAIASLAGSR
jgi:hypothetical protein